MHFSPREQEILHLLAQCRTYAQMAAALGISIRTIYTHIHNIARKVDYSLNRSNQPKLIAYAIEHGYGRKVNT